MTLKSDLCRRHRDALHYSMDGNYHFNMKHKRRDPDDYPLTLGASYFANEDDFEYYLANAPRPRNEVRTVALETTHDSQWRLCRNRLATSLPQWAKANTRDR